MKKFCSTAFVSIIYIFCFLVVTACGSYTGEIANFNLQDFDETGLAFFVGKNVNYKNDLLNAVNQAIDDLGNDKLSELVQHHNNIVDGIPSDLSFTIPNLSNNTAGTIFIYSSVDGPPFDYLGSENVVMGVEIDILKFAANILNKKIETRICTFGSIVQNITAPSSEWRLSGVGMRRTPEREQVVSFSNDFWTMKLSVISKESASYKTLSDLNGKKIGGYTGESGAIFIKEKIDIGVLSAETKLFEYTTPQSAFQSFLTGKVDAIVVLDYIADGLVKNR